MTTDAWGLEMTAPDPPAAVSDDAAERYDALITGMWTFAPDLLDRLTRAVAEPVLPLARIAHAYFAVQAHTPTEQQRAAEIVRSLDPDRLNDRERLHAEAARSWVEGDHDRTADTWDRILETWPTDALAFRLQHVVLFNRGRLADMLASVERSRSAWDGRPLDSYIGGMASFALEELGRYTEAESEGRAAVDADSTDLWSLHAVAHVLEMEARTEDGLAWFEGRDDVLHSKGGFARHLWWHHAIIHLRTGDHARILDLYDREIEPGDILEPLVLTNAIDGLARLEFAGVDVGDRWAYLAAPASRRIGHHTHPFADCHFAYALARAGATDELEQLLTGMAEWQDRATTAGEVLSTVGVDVAEGMAALGRGDRIEAAQRLTRSADDRWQLGGSHAQRRLFDLAQAAAG